MSGHSKWATIKRQKGVADAKRGNLFTKLANTITIAARSGDGNPETNFRLRLAIDKAKAASMPKENIERAIKRGTGELGGVQIEEVNYEGYGPGGIAILVETLTDNKNRTGPVIRNIFSKHGGNMGNIGSVVWMFEQKGVIRLDLSAANKPKDEIELAAIDGGAEDVREGNGDLMILCPKQDLEGLKKNLESKGIAIEYAEMEYVASTPMNVDNTKTREQLDALYADLDANDDVNNYYTNES